MILGWTALQPSARERRLRLAAALVALAVAIALASAALNADPRHPTRLWIAVLAAAGAACWSALGARRAARRRAELSIGPDGIPQLRPGDPRPASGPDAARCVFAAPWLITLRCGAMLVPIWPDSLPPDAFRRLHACARWTGVGRAGPDNDRRNGRDDDFPP